MKTPLRIHYLQHVPFEEPGYIDAWAKQRQHILTSTKLYESVSLPQLNDFDMLIIMGGPMNIYQHEQYPWLPAEKEFIKNAIAATKLVVGICLGSQLIAAVLGSTIYRNKKKEIGWFPLTKTTAGKNCELLADLPSEFIAFHWHGETFDLPDGAIHLLQSSVCAHQAFLYNNHVLGLQFHLEATPATIAAMIENCRNELEKDDFIQTAQQLVDGFSHCNSINRFLTSLLNNFARLPVLK